MITPDQAEAILICLLCLFCLTGGVLIGYLARPLGEVSEPADRAAAGWWAAYEPTTYRPENTDDVPDFMRWDAERGHRG